MVNIMNITSQVLGFLGVLSNIIGVQLKNKRNIMIAFIIANIFFSLCFLLLKSYSGMVISLFSVVQTVINYSFDKKDKKIPKYLIIFYIIISIICGLLTYKKALDVLPIICSILYTLSIVQTMEKRIRFITLINVSLWTAYDFMVGAYASGINSIILISSTLIAIIRYDILKRQKK